MKATLATMAGRKVSVEYYDGDNDLCYLYGILTDINSVGVMLNLPSDTLAFVPMTRVTSIFEKT